MNILVKFAILNEKLVLPVYLIYIFFIHVQILDCYRKTIYNYH
jgi:hypothetical protein